MDNLVETLQRARQADPVAVESLIVHFGATVRSECDAYSFPESEMSVSDLYQEAMFRIWTQLHQFRGCDQEEPCHLMFHQWLRKTTHSVIFNLFERQQAARRTPNGANQRIVSFAENQEVAFASDDTPSKLAGGAEDAARVRAAIAELDDEERAMVELCFYGECTLKEAAEAMQITYDQARARFHRALNRLRFQLQ